MSTCQRFNSVNQRSSKMLQLVQRKIERTTHINSKKYLNEFISSCKTGKRKLYFHLNDFTCMDTDNNHLQCCQVSTTLRAVKQLKDNGSCRRAGSGALEECVLRQRLVFHLRQLVIILVHFKVFHKFHNAFKIQNNHSLIN